MITNDLQKHLNSINFDYISDKEELLKILNSKQTSIVFKSITPAYTLEKLRNNKNYYLLLSIGNIRVLLKDNIIIKVNTGKKMLMFVMIVGALLLAYLATISKLYPIRRLIKDVQRLGQGDFNINCATNKEDEISLLSNEFDKSAKKLKNLKETRNIFIRNIMHELKTPIMKGKFLIELSSSDNNKEKLKAVFARLELLISEFAGIEELMSSTNETKKLNISNYHIQDLLDNALDILMCDENHICNNLEDKTLKVNFKLFSIVIKNLIDNAIKYSTDGKVILENKDYIISFISKGNKLKYDLKTYFQPFSNSNNSNNSFGLGLYIVNYILKAHNMKLKYDYKEGYNIFYIV